MQYVDDDMDELFKKAAEGYPLDTKGADWNKVWAALENKPETKGGKEGGKNRRFLWLLLLLPLGLICYQFYSPVSSGDKQATKGDIEESSSSVSITAKENNSTSKKLYNPATADNSLIKETKTLASPAKQDLKTAEKSSSIFNRSVPTQKASYSLNTRYSKANTPDIYSASNNSFYDQKGDQSLGANDLSMANQFSSRNYRSVASLQRQPLGEVSTSVSRSLIPLFQFSDQSKQNIRAARRKKLYAGLMGGLDATTIKFQKIEAAGSSVGLLLGYQLNRKWSVETGAYLEKKYYYSEGKYLNTTKIDYMPPNAWIEDATGDCRMIEIPVNVKYNFSTGKRSTWFGTLGTSSYIMQREDYTYNYYYGTTGPVPHKKEYKNSSTNLFSVLSVSGGYAHRLGNFGDVRIEPYLKLPLSGMGVGKLPFLSTGLQVGVTRKF